MEYLDVVLQEAAASKYNFRIMTCIRDGKFQISKSKIKYLRQYMVEHFP